MTLYVKRLCVCDIVYEREELCMRDCVRDYAREILCMSSTTTVRDCVRDGVCIGETESLLDRTVRERLKDRIYAFVRERGERVLVCVCETHTDTPARPLCVCLALLVCLGTLLAACPE